MPRPSGAPFWGESRACNWDYALLSGTSDYWDARNGEFVLDNDFSIGAVGWRSEGDGSLPTYDDYVRLHDGSSSVVMAYKGNTYLETTDDVGDVNISWIIRTKGAGTISCYDDYDTDWDYSLPSNSLGDVSVTSGGTWFDSEIAAGPYTMAELNGSGAQRLGLVVDGTVDIDVIYLRIWPVGGPLGWWRSESFEVQEKPAQIMTISNGIGDTAVSSTFYEFDLEDDEGVGQALAWEDMKDVAAAGTIEKRENTTSGRGYCGTDASDYYISSLGGTEHVGKWRYDTSYMVIDAGDIRQEAPHAFEVFETEGIDWIRRPDRNYQDLKAYFEYVVPTAEPSIGGWINDVARIVGGREAQNAADDWPTGTDAHAVSINVNSYPYDYPPPLPGDRPNVNAYPFALGDLRYEMNDLSIDAETDMEIGLSLPSEPKFMISLGNSFTETFPPRTGLSGSVAMPGTSVRQYATLYIAWDDVSGSLGTWLKAEVVFPAHRSWDPYGVPGGGKLKVWLPSEEWRIIGNEAGSDTERLKIQTPDLTWWKEYRTSDGAVTTHPLKIYTADGWIVAANMTPD